MTKSPVLSKATSEAVPERDQFALEPDQDDEEVNSFLAGLTDEEIEALAERIAEAVKTKSA